MPNITFEIVLGSDTMITRETTASVVGMLNRRGLTVVKRGYTTWALYEGELRVGSMREC